MLTNIKQDKDTFDYSSLIGEPIEIKGEPESAIRDWITALSIFIIIGAIAFHLGWKSASGG